jgi:large conductance mechanosensitive channel
MTAFATSSYTYAPSEALDSFRHEWHFWRMSIIQEFKDFINRGNVVDLAVGVAVGAAFGRVVTSLVEDVIMPPIGRILSDLDFSNLYLPLSSKVPYGLPPKDARALGPILAYGNFLTVVINFIIIAFCIFLVVKAMNTFKRREAAKPAEPKADPKDVLLLQEIRDLLKEGKK